MKSMRLVVIVAFDEFDMLVSVFVHVSFDLH